MIEIIRPLTEFSECINKKGNIVDNFREGLSKIKKFKEQLTLINGTHTNNGHDVLNSDLNPVDFVNRFRKTVHVRHYIKILDASLESFNNSLKLIQVTKVQRKGKVPSLYQLNILLNTPYNDNNECAILNENFEYKSINNEIKQVILEPDCKMIKCWTNINKDSKILQHYAYRYNRILNEREGYVYNKQAKFVLKRVEDSYYNTRNAYSNDDVNKLYNNIYL